MARGTWHPALILRYIETIPSSTYVARVETDAGEGFLKALGNPEGPHVLACEWVGTLLAEWFGLRVLDCAIIEVTPEDEIPLRDGTLASPGPAFVTKFERGFQWGGKADSLRRVTNPADISRLVVFDTWIRNCDRYRPAPGKRANRDNVFLSQAMKPPGLILKAIDHTHAFTCGRALTPRLGHIDDVQDSTVFGNFPEFSSFLEPEAVESAAARLGAITVAEVARFVESVPRAWDVAPEVRQAWVRLVTGRAKFVAANIGQWLFG